MSGNKKMYDQASDEEDDDDDDEAIKIDDVDDDDEFNEPKTTTHTVHRTTMTIICTRSALPESLSLTASKPALIFISCLATLE